MTKGASQEGRGLALVVGVAHYANVTPLPNAVLNDAIAVAEILGDPIACGYRKENVRLLLDEAATAAGIQAALHDLASTAAPNDTVVIFFSGHGGQLSGPSGTSAALLGVDFDSRDPASGALREPDLTRAFREIKARRLLVLLDACHSAGAANPKATATFQPGVAKEALENLTRGVGRVIISSCRQAEFSWVLPGRANSLFTEHLIAALRGEGGYDPTGHVCVFDIFNHISTRVRGEVPEQHPVFAAQDLEDNFPVALARPRAPPVPPAAPAGPQVSDPWATLAAILPKLYPLGPADLNAWTRAGGHPVADLGAMSPAAAWTAALRRLKRGEEAPTLSADSLLAVALEDYPHHRDLAALGTRRSGGWRGRERVAIGLDVGSKTTRIWSEDAGRLLEEASVASLGSSGPRRTVRHAGAKAQAEADQAPGLVKLVYPIKNGLVGDADLTGAMLGLFLQKAGVRRGVWGARVVAAHPSGAGPVFARALARAVLQAGAGKVGLIPTPIAAGLGAGVGIGDPRGSIVMHVGGSFTDIAVISAGSIVYSRSVEVGGDDFTGAIISWILRNRGVRISESVAEYLKRSMRSNVLDNDVLSFEVQGWYVFGGGPREIRVSERDLEYAVSIPLNNLLEVAKKTVGAVGNSLTDGITKNGFTLTGGGALMSGLGEAIAAQTQVPVRVATDPASSVAEGCAIALGADPGLRLAWYRRSFLTGREVLARPDI